MISQEKAVSLLKKWSPVLEATGRIRNEEIRLATAVVLENSERQVMGKKCINEAAGLGVGDVGIASYNTPHDGTSGVLKTGNNVLPTLVIPMVRRIFPELMAHETTSVQPMTGPVGFAFAFRALYGKNGQIDGKFETPTDAINGTNMNELGYNNMYANFTGASAAVP